ncbi:hypothetical protein K469DRAFT_699255 [Zopfia rhizophila CBS 207.26]|uniref:Uncharacterized protein n=1 Tax=Zopfia rhizophila CBS 207.26 TaxID=1314779 RepID=A0A6A6EXY1_9PEZI|nr:hypothetical protein K469DRAFT_699255 [Zopfia rhizophila CBS 207.26]
MVFKTDWPGDELEYIWRALTPPCKTPDSYPSTSTPVTCLVQPTALGPSTSDHFKILYWPVTTKMDFCVSINATKRTINPSGTIPGRPNTAEFSGLKLTSPTIYFFLHNVTIETYAGLSSNKSMLTPFAPPIRTATQALNPRSTTISSIAFNCTNIAYKKCPRATRSFNFADLTPSPPKFTLRIHTV